MQEAGIGHVLRDQMGLSRTGNAALDCLVKHINKCFTNVPLQMFTTLCHPQEIRAETSTGP